MVLIVTISQPLPCMLPMSQTMRLVHLPDQSVDLLLAITEIAALNKVLEFSLVKPASRVAQVKRPEEVAGLLEVGSYGENLFFSSACY